MNILQLRGGAPTSLRAAAALTNAYVASSSIDLKSYDSVALMLKVSATESDTITMKYDWSNDDADTVTNWYSETVEILGTIASNEQPSTSYIRTTTISMAVAQNPIIRARRMGRHFRVQVKATGSTTATLAITAMPMCNQN